MAHGKKRKKYIKASHDGIVNHSFPVKQGNVSQRALCGVVNSSDLRDGIEDCRPCEAVKEQSW